MKKLIASFTVVVYFAFACGVMVNMHYCMDRYDSFRLYTPKADYCTKCGMHTKAHGCCHDEVTVLKIQDDYQTSSASYSFKAPAVAVVTLPDFIIASIKENDRAFVPDHAPPLLSEQDIYLQNRVFRI